MGKACETLPLAFCDFVTRTVGVGSVGVIALHLDQTGFDEKAGRKYTAIYPGARKNDFNPHGALSGSAKDELQSEIDRLYDMFVGIRFLGRATNCSHTLLRAQRGVPQKLWVTGQVPAGRWCSVYGRRSLREGDR